MAYNDLPGLPHPINEPERGEIPTDPELEPPILDSIASASADHLSIPPIGLDPL